MAEDFLPLNAVVSALRAEIVAARRAAAADSVKFELGPIEVEFQMVAKREGGPTGSIKFGILGFGADLGANAKFAKEQTQRVKFNLSPLAAEPDGTRRRLEINRGNSGSQGERPSRNRPKAEAEGALGLGWSPGRAVSLQFAQLSAGSGYLITPRHVLTARHVVKPPRLKTRCQMQLLKTIASRARASLRGGTGLPSPKP